MQQNPPQPGGRHRAPVLSFRQWFGQFLTDIEPVAVVIAPFLTVAAIILFAVLL